MLRGRAWPATGRRSARLIVQARPQSGGRFRPIRRVRLRPRFQKSLKMTVYVPAQAGSSAMAATSAALPASRRPPLPQQAQRRAGAGARVTTVGAGSAGSEGAMAVEVGVVVATPLSDRSSRSGRSTRAMGIIRMPAAASAPIRTKRGSTLTRARRRFLRLHPVVDRAPVGQVEVVERVGPSWREGRRRGWKCCGPGRHHAVSARAFDPRLAGGHASVGSLGGGHAAGVAGRRQRPAAVPGRIGPEHGLVVDVAHDGASAARPRAHEGHWSTPFRHATAMSESSDRHQASGRCRCSNGPSDRARSRPRRLADRLRSGASGRRGWDLNPRTTLRWSTP